MKILIIILFLLSCGLLFMAFTANPKENTSAPGTTTDSLAAERQKYISGILESLKGRENTACDSVFNNIKTFRNRQRVVVRHFLGIMDYWGQTLNVSCNYCHNTADWASDELRTKDIARQMFNMRVVINNEILAKIADLKSKPARVNCGTCHNGSPFPKE